MPKNSGTIGGGGFSMSFKWQSHTVVDYEKAANLMAALAMGHIKSRTARGTDMHGKAFHPYSPAYRSALAKAGQDQKVNLMLTGGLLNSVGVRKKRATKKSAKVQIGLSSGTSAQVSLGTTARRTGRRGPPHNLLGAWLHHGHGRLPPRPFMGLSSEGRKEIAAALTNPKAGIIKYKHGPPKK